jgi:hypothetical protein
MQFAQSEVAVGEPLVLTATPEDPTSTGPLVVRIASSSGATVSDTLNVWARMSDQEILAVLVQANGRAFVGFKEAGAERGVSPQGESLTSAATVRRMKEYLMSQGVVITSAYDLPAVAAQVPVTLALVSAIRRHLNVDYFEPILPGKRLGTDAPQAAILAAVTATTTDDSDLRVRSGDVVTATYRQPDGTVLKATATIR